MARVEATPRFIRHVTESLLRILRQNLGAFIAPNRVIAAPPETISQLPDPQERVVLYLYRVAESPHLKNQGPDYVPVSDGAGGPSRVMVRKDPLAIDLHYLLIPYSGDAGRLETYEILGYAMRAFHDQGVFSPAELGVPELTDSEQKIELRLTAESLSLEQLSAIWEAVHEPYRLSVSYCVRTLLIGSDLSTSEGRVEERRLLMESVS